MPQSIPKPASAPSAAPPSAPGNTFTYKAPTNDTQGSYYDLGGTGMPAVAFNFVVVEEVGAEGFLVRKGYVMSAETLSKFKEWELSEAQVRRELHPEKHGITPRGGYEPYQHPVRQSLTTLGPTNRIVEGVSHPSSFISTSSFEHGAHQFQGKTVYLDIARMKNAGVKIISTEELVASLRAYQKAHPHLDCIEMLTRHVRAEGEVLLHAPKVPASAVFTPDTVQTVTARTEAAIKAVRVVSVLGIMLTGYDLTVAAEKSAELKSVKPIAAEAIRQAGGWGGARAGFLVGSAIGTAVGIETGPFMVLTGLVGGIVFGVGGFYGANWVANFIDKK